MDSEIVRYNDFKKKLSSSVSNFNEVNEFLVVDKSLFIKEVIEFPEKIFIIVRPHLFGKTLNLHMLKQFFDNNQDDKGKRRQLFNGRYIEKMEDTFYNHFAKYPVLYISFKDCKGKSWEDVTCNISAVIAELYQQHKCILNFLNEAEQREFRKITNKELSIQELQRSLRALSEYLTRYYKSKCVVLIDDYDTLLENAFDSPFYEDAEMFFNVMLSSLLEDNIENIFKAVLVGILPATKTSSMSGLNNVSVYSLLNDEVFSPFFGFTEGEVEMLISHYHPSIKKKEVRDWYNGYLTVNEARLYNPYSILKFCQFGKFDNYGIDLGGIRTLKIHLRNASCAFMRNVAELVVKGNKLKVRIMDSLTDKKTKIIKNEFDETLWTLILYAGYLNNVSSEKQGAIDEFMVDIPNTEVRNAWVTWIHCKSDSQGEFMLDKIQNYDIKGFIKDLQQFSLECFSFFDLGSNPPPQKFYQGFLIGIINTAIKYQYIPVSNRESGEVRYDVTLEPMDISGSQLGITFELKSAKKLEDLEKSANQAMSQMVDRNYISRRLTYLKKYLEVVISFYRKEIHLLYRLYRKENNEWVLQDSNMLQPSQKRKRSIST